MSTESLKRVLTRIKGEARGMRRNKFEARLKPNPPPVAMPPTEGTEDEVQAPPEKAADTISAIQEVIDRHHNGASDPEEE